MHTHTHTHTHTCSDDEHEVGSSVWGKDTKAMDEDVFAPKEEEDEVHLWRERARKGERAREREREGEKERRKGGDDRCMERGFRV